MVKKAFPARWLIARATRHPLVGAALGRLVDLLLFEGDELYVLPRERVSAPLRRDVELGVDLPAPESRVLPSAVVEHFVRKSTYHFKMDFCICRSAEGCADYPVDYGCLFLGEGAKDINPALGQVLSVDEALEYARKCREAGLVHVVGRNKLDAAWLGVGDGSRLLTICNCCPCCCLWKVAPALPARISDKFASLPGVAAVVDPGACVGCGKCAGGACFVGAIKLVSVPGEGRARRVASVSGACRGCGRCVDACPKGAISLPPVDPGAVRRSIARLERLVDVT